MRKFFSAAFFLLILSGCANKENSPSDENFSFSEEKKSSEELRKNSAVDTIKNRGLLQPERLFGTLPENISGTQPLPPTYGKISEKEGEASTAQREYQFRTGGMLTIAVTDYAANPAIVRQWKTAFTKVSATQPGIIVKNISGKNYSGYESWTSSQRSSALKAIVRNRFLVEVRATKMPENAQTLEEVMQMVNLPE